MERGTKLELQSRPKEEKQSFSRRLSLGSEIGAKLPVNKT
jgi:hypothetical protein